MGYVYDVRVRGGVVTLLVTMPHRGRPVYDFLVTQGGGRVEEGIRERLLKLQGVREVFVAFTWNPPWTAARLTDAGRREMGLSI
jgi:metal-sulfur cluster biosynthetic enzyme